MIVRNLFTGVALCLGFLLPASGAQVSAPGTSQVVPTPFVGGPVIHTQLSRVGGRMRVTPMVPSQGSADVVTFANTSWSGFYALQGSGGEEWVDFGVKTGSGLPEPTPGVSPDSLSISKLTVGYATTSPTPSFTLTLYAKTEGDCEGAGKGQALLELPLTSDPAQGGLTGSPSGLPITVIHTFCPADLLTALTTPKFEEVIPAPDTGAAFGWGIKASDGSTGPLLVSVGSDPTGTQDSFLHYVQPDICQLSAFSVPGIASFYLQVEEGPAGIDCDDDGRDDAAEIVLGIDLDCNGNEIPDECETDCNKNGIPDDCDITDGTSQDCNTNSIPDECDIADGTSLDCNSNGIPDECDIASGSSVDANSDGQPDECKPDCNGNGVPDYLDINFGLSQDCDLNGIPDECEHDCNGNGLADQSDLNN